MESTLYNSKLIKISGFYGQKIFPKISKLRGTTRAKDILGKLFVKLITSKEKDCYTLFIDKKNVRKIKNIEDIATFVGIEHSQSIKMIDSISSNSIVYDIGGYHGYHTILGTLGKKVYTFEPDPENLKILKENISLNPEQDILLIEKPVWDKEEKITIVTGKKGKSHIGEEGLTKEAVTLDQFVFKEKNSPPDFMKIDVEGAEYKVLKGAEKVLEKYKPKLMIEVHKGERIQQIGGSEKELVKLLRSKGYNTIKEIKRGKETHLFLE